MFTALTKSPGKFAGALAGVGAVCVLLHECCTRTPEPSLELLLSEQLESNDAANFSLAFSEYVASATALSKAIRGHDIVSGMREFNAMCLNSADLTEEDKRLVLRCISRHQSLLTLKIQIELGVVQNFNSVQSLFSAALDHGSILETWMAASLLTKYPEADILSLQEPVRTAARRCINNMFAPDSGLPGAALQSAEGIATNIVLANSIRAKLKEAAESHNDRAWQSISVGEPFLELFKVLGCDFFFRLAAEMAKNGELDKSRPALYMLEAAHDLVQERAPGSVPSARETEYWLSMRTHKHAFISGVAQIISGTIPGMVDWEIKSAFVGGKIINYTE